MVSPSETTFTDTPHGRVDLLFGDGHVRGIPLSPPLKDHPGFTVVRKNAGDDPDCTHGMLVAGKITRLSEDMSLPDDSGAHACASRASAPVTSIPDSTQVKGRSDASSIPDSGLPSCPTSASGPTGASSPGFSPDPRDIVLDLETCEGPARLVLRCPMGVGLVTRPGLDCEPGHWAVNPGVREMIATNLLRHGLTKGLWLCKLILPDGAQRASRTLNRTLGVEGGLSLLGTTGLVRPFSHEAYAASLRVSLRQARLLGDTVVLATGTRTAKAARRWAQSEPSMLGFNPEACLSMADFLADALSSCVEADFRRVVVACMPGKILKMAAGQENTHAHRNAQNMGLLAEVCGRLFPGRADPALSPPDRSAPGRSGPDHSDPDHSGPDHSESGRVNPGRVDSDRPGLPARVAAMGGMREALELFDEREKAALFRELGRLALAHLERLCAGKRREREQGSGTPGTSSRASATGTGHVDESRGFPEGGRPACALLLVGFEGEVLAFFKGDGF